MNRWLWGLLILGMVLGAPFGRVHGKPGVGSPTPVLIPPFAAPVTMPALGEELARGLYAALRDANIPARLGKGDDSSAIVGRLEELSQAQVRLQASYRGHSVQSVGDLEHLDDLVYAVFTQLRPRLQAATAGDPRAIDLSAPSAPLAPGSDPSAPISLPPPPTVSPASPTLKETGKESASAARPVSVKVPGSAAAKVVHTSRPVETRPEPPATPVPTKEPVMASLPSPPMVPVEPGGGPEASHLPKNSGVLAPRPPPAPFPLDPRRPRIAVHVIGDPVARIPAGYSGLGSVGQQSLIGYLQQRLRLPAVASRLIGLTGGLVALDQSLRVGARHTLMVRLDSLVLAPSPTSPMAGGMGSSAYAGGTLSGRIHIVLLHDGKLMFDRSVPLPPTLALASENPAQVYSRSLVTAIDSVAGELAGRIAESQSSASPAAPRSP